jgi:hypothetical protein
MRPSTVLRICVVLEWTFLGLGIVSSFLLESSLPDPLRDWLAADAEGDIALREVGLLVVMIPLLLCALVGSIGLLFLKRWAAWLYLISLIIGYALFPFMGPTVEHALADAADDMAVLLSGLIIGLAFFSDALRVRIAEPSAAPNGGPATRLGNSGVTEGPPSVS